MDSYLTAQNPVDVFKWAKEEGGAAIVLKIFIENGAEYRANLLIFDAIGNLVYSRKSNGPLDLDNAETGTIKQAAFYWNGITDKNRKAAPGIYKAVVVVENPKGSRIPPYRSNIGIGR
jgi:hypothetical protein